ncbi:hypothetical protein BHM03_00005518 [Ensete ventricosum]|nr:hypothetical protein BHM03_00005518 [Ensete ventricosum]
MSLLRDLISLDQPHREDHRRRVHMTPSGPDSDPSKLPKRNYDGSSRGQAPGDASEVIV